MTTTAAAPAGLLSLAAPILARRWPITLQAATAAIVDVAEELDLTAEDMAAIVWAANHQAGATSWVIHAPARRSLPSSSWTLRKSPFSRG